MLAPDTFKDVMSAVAASVTVVTARGADETVGITVSAFTSVSADPPIVLVCIDKRAGSLPAFLDADGYTVNFMPEGTGDIAMVFATPGADKFGSVDSSEPTSGHGGPVLDAAFATFECSVLERVEMGDHWVLYGQVEGGGRTDTEADALIWAKRGFVRIERY